MVKEVYCIDKDSRVQSSLLPRKWSIKLKREKEALAGEVRIDNMIIWTTYENC